MGVFHVGRQVEVTVAGSPRDRELRAQRSRADVALSRKSYDEYEADEADNTDEVDEQADDEG